MKKKIVFITVLMLITVFLTSCFESMQSVTYENGYYLINSKITLSKESYSTLLYIGGVVEDGLDSVDDYDDFDSFSDSLEDSINKSNSSVVPKMSQKDIDDLYNDFRKSFVFPTVGTVSKVDTQSDVGICYAGKVSESYYSSSAFAPFIPKIYKNAVTLEISKNVMELAKECGELTGLLTGIKHKVYISKTILKTVSKAEITDSGYNGKEVGFNDLGDMWCIDIPYSYFASTDGKNLKYIVVYY